ncbi:MAG: helix-turn-helix domain-containing protein [Microbacterium sp.]
MPRVPSAAAALIGSHIAELRRRRSMTQDQLAVASDIDSSNIRSYENGRAMMNVFSLVRIAEALDVAPGDLLDGISSDLFASERPDRRRARSAARAQ